MTSAPHRRGRPPRLSPEAILDAALALLDDAGLEGLTMRALARRLRADPMAVYRHFEGKDALLAALCDRVLAELEPLDPATPWREQLEALAVDIRGRMLGHPGLVAVLAAAPMTPATVVLAQQVLRAMDAAGFADDAAADGLGATLSYVLGYVLVEQAAPNQGDELTADTAEDPRLARTLSWGTADRDFAGGLRLLFDGLEARRGTG